MFNHKTQEKLTNFFYALVIVISITILSFFEAFILPNELAYDFFERLMPKAQVHKVLLIEVPLDTHKLEPKTWLTLLKILEQKQAKQVVFTFMPSDVSSAFYCHAQKSGNVFFARPLQHDYHNNQVTLEPLPKTSCDIHFGVVDIPPHTLGIHSQQYDAFQIKGESYPALEVIAAEHFTSFKPINAPYHVNFGNRIDSLPRLQLDRILAGDLVSELVKERSVIVGYARDNVGLHTPLSMVHNTMISMPEYHALALNTLLSDERVIILNIKWTFLLLLNLLLLSMLVSRWLTIKQSLQLTLVFISIEFISAWMLYRYAHFGIPLGEMIMVQGLLYWIDLKTKMLNSAENTLYETLMESSFKLDESINSKSFSTDEYWSQIIMMGNEILGLNRQIVLAWCQGQPYANEVKALHCSLVDIDEKQRSYKKSPYTTAIKEKKVIHLKRDLLNPVDAAEEQYLVALFFGREVLGFWLLTIESSKPYNKKQFEESINDLANQMAKSLYHRQQWLLRTQTDKNLINRYVHSESDGWVYKALDNSITALEHQLLVLENIMDDLDTAIILYDVFGTVIRVNRRMKALSQTFGMKFHQMTALGFLMAVSQVDMEKAREYFRHIFLKQGNIVRQVKLMASIERFFILNMQLFYYQERVEGVESKIKQGILCQLIDVTQMKLQSTLKEQIAERLIFKFRNDMQSILTASNLLTSAKSGETEKRMVAGILKTKVNAHLQILNEVEKQLNVHLDATKTTTIKTYPVNAKESVLEAMESVAEMALKRQVTLQSDLPALVSLVFAAPYELTLVIASILTLLIDDATSQTEITINMEERDKWVTYRLKNVGFGIPNDRFQQYLFSNDVEISDKFKGIRRTIRVVKVWEGTLTAESQVGMGISFELRLRSFI